MKKFISTPWGSILVCFLGTMIATFCLDGYIHWLYHQVEPRAFVLPAPYWQHWWQWRQGQGWTALALTMGLLSFPTFLVALLSAGIASTGWITWRRTGAAAWIWTVVGLHPLLFYIALFFHAPGYATLLGALTPLFISAVASVWLTLLWNILLPESRATPLSFSLVRIVLPLLAIVYATTFSGLAIALYHNLFTPHGDSAMYEEHLWNLLHGKGFRSQLDGGRLFFGEHFQFIHMFLIPLYVLFPWAPTLMVCQSVALALGGGAVFTLARQRGNPMRAALLWTLAYYLYFPLQYLSIEGTWKTIRPENFGVPLVLYALVALECRRWVWMTLLLSLSFCAKEEYTLVAAALGLYLAGRGPWRLSPSIPDLPPPTIPSWRERLGGVLLTLATLTFLIAIITWWIPFFRAGEPPHYTPYFRSWGNTPGEIVTQVLGNPRAVLLRVIEPAKLLFILQLLVPLGMLPVISPSRFLVAIPIAAYLLLGDRESLWQPWFHFHAPLIPLLFWSAIAGGSNVTSYYLGLSSCTLARAVVLLTLTTGMGYGRGPWSWKFYDPVQGIPRVATPTGILFKPEGSYWRDLYVPNERTRAFEKVWTYVNDTDRVAATDYIRARFTHCRAAHDYPFRHHVSIDDIDAIILDKTEGYWGRGPTNPDGALLASLADWPPSIGKIISIRAKNFVIVHHDTYFWVARREASLP